EECHRLIGTTFTSDIYPLRYRIPSYGEWLVGQDMRRPYAFHRTLLRCLLWRDPGGHVAIKCPTHLWHLDALAATYPQCRLVRPPLPRAGSAGPSRRPPLRARGVRREPGRARGTARQLQEGVRTMTVQAKAPVEETHETRARRDVEAVNRECGPNPVRIGILTPLSPPGDPTAGELETRGACIGAEYVREHGGILGGRNVELLLVNDLEGATDTTMAESAVRGLKWLNEQGAVAVLGQW